jgi:hypothetical protein
MALYGIRQHCLMPYKAVGLFYFLQTNIFEKYSKSYRLCLFFCRKCKKILHNSPIRRVLTNYIIMQGTWVVELKLKKKKFRGPQICRYKKKQKTYLPVMCSNLNLQIFLYIAYNKFEFYHIYK